MVIVTILDSNDNQHNFHIKNNLLYKNFQQNEMLVHLTKVMLTITGTLRISIKKNFQEKFNLMKALEKTNSIVLEITSLLIDAIKQNNNITELNTTNLGESNTIMLAQFLKTNETIISWNNSNNKLSELTVAEVIDHLKYNSTLLNITLNSNNDFHTIYKKQLTTIINKNRTLASNRKTKRKINFSCSV